MSNSNNGNGGLGLCSVLTIVFIVLKLTKVINWSWLWVLSPLWISFLLGLVLILIYAWAYDKRFSGKRRYKGRERSDRIRW